MQKKRSFLSTGYEIVVFDCDSTLTKIEGIDLLAKKGGKAKEVKFLTKQAMNGKIPFDQVFPKRLALIRPKRKDLVWLGKEYIKHQVRDAKETIKILKQLRKKVYIITHGFKKAVEIFAKHLGISKKDVFAVKLNFDEDGNYLHFDFRDPLAKRGGKRKVLQNLSKQGKIILVGDGATDLEAKDVVDLFVGFGGVIVRPIVREKADIYINCQSLLPIVVFAPSLRL